MEEQEPPRFHVEKAYSGEFREFMYRVIDHTGAHWRNASGANFYGWYETQAKAKEGADFMNANRGRYHTRQVGPSAPIQ